MSSSAQRSPVIAGNGSDVLNPESSARRVRASGCYEGFRRERGWDTGAIQQYAGASKGISPAVSIGRETQGRSGSL